ncbi:methyltransferase domain-containing protein [Rhodococcus sp. BP-252]|uniref:methyltransferase domain-containing protein n=1 Tax=unclassified Rhodococcus (in: high G+C Gram-positive bacteria) TaxID=192944 RepID=UPI0014320998|nr:MULTISPECIES: methyltransferase domain-containing protein [unclassified Rhodococcus (in: high G+C Gram-positive bacteria)]NIL74209.1 23S rRNA (guanine-N(1))-methyltransferase [Rhodococcus sp. B10]MBY6411650.1 methyltransferase domain-containing protein [Rhodococcus sp. BP-320]MBY6417365.1 methyltransferase domain-containing protein [Rhodococcus sp. BP-321]MBY6421850.1 methyltransferase domain-containing protein [Rhodococcus sp. BP-324]MBY6427389.1 methyltransferase domain-containing protein
MLADVIDLLICPLCGSDLDFGDDDKFLLCDRGHTFDVARQGYVSLQSGGAGKITGDSADMIAARADFLDAGHFAPIADAVSQAVGSVGSVGTVLEVGAGTGHYLAAVLDAADGARGIGVDVSKAAARRVARAHPRLGSIVADVWQGLPVRDGSIDAVTCVFSPRNASELRRVLAPEGILVVVTPTERHQRELTATVGLIGVDEDKARRLGDSLAGRFEAVERDVVEYAVQLDHDAVEAFVAMGPSARHTTPAARRASIESMPEPVHVTVSVTVGTYRAV